jgi:hypothetical protein
LVSAFILRSSSVSSDSVPVTAQAASDVTGQHARVVADAVDESGFATAGELQPEAYSPRR